MTALTRRPKYRQIADDLRAKIGDGTYPVGTPLPSTSQLMESYEVSVTVARAAVKELQSEGIAEGQPGKAVYVQREPPPATGSVEYREITKQIEALRESFGQAVQELEDRLTTLERTTSGSGRLLKHSEQPGELDRLRSQVELLGSHLIALYERLGQPYPYESLNRVIDQSATER